MQWSESAICVHISLPSCTSLPSSSSNTHPGHHRAPSWALCTLQKLPTICFTHAIAYTSILISQFIPPSLPLLVHTFVLYICISILALTLFFKGVEVLSKLGHFQMPKQVAWLSLLLFYCNPSRRWPMRPDDLGKSYYIIFRSSALTGQYNWAEQLLCFVHSYAPST